MEAIFWFHPLVWWIGARLIEERERACDEEVLRLGNHPSIYAESILKTCQFYLESPLPCLSGVTGSDLKKRITQIMNASLTTNLTGERNFCSPALPLLLLRFRCLPAWRKQHLLPLSKSLPSSRRSRAR